MKLIDHLQGLGRALMLPIAVLPVAGLLLRLGQDDVAGPVARVLPLVHLSFLASAGGAIFDNLGLLFAIGAAVGLARENHGAAGLAGVVCFLVATTGAGAVLQVHPDIPAGLAPPLADLVMADARKAGLDIKKLQADMASPEVAKILTDSRAFGHKVALEGTPTFIINGVMYPQAMDDDAIAAAFKKS